ncbi:MAG: hypothetical protein Unbinned4234contig1003_35 [Prokaryotic dsDNA virus sp.]|nr:MAG: hypothetical protein Unbinned4234contig1003_35 [Prokaryotic dsDNA virus sp.]|tara:strand:+ start:9896 stop:11062 length:1167 start_codon:yes stop_codon:yes gene_type:complete
MPSNELKTPVFYMNVVEWLASIGWLHGSGHGIKFHTTLEASNPKEVPLPYNANGNNDSLQLPKFGPHVPVRGSRANVLPYKAIFGSNGCVGFLGHNFASADVIVGIQEGVANTSSPYNEETATDYKPLYIKDSGMVNMSFNSPDWKFSTTYDGFSFYRCDYSDFDQTANPAQIRWESGAWGANDTSPYNGLGRPSVGCIFLGSYFQMPINANINMSISYQMDGVDTVTTPGGTYLYNAKYTRPKKWGKLGAFELHSGSDSTTASLTGDGARIGRRVVNMSFSFLDSSEIFPLIESTGFLWNDTFSGRSQGSMDANYERTTDDLLLGNNFISQVLIRCNGGQLPFLLHLDSNDNTPGNFMLAKFDQSSFQFNQVSRNKYNFSCKIKEVW